MYFYLKLQNYNILPYLSKKMETFCSFGIELEVLFLFLHLF